MQSRSFAALRYRDFRKYLSIRFFFTLATQMQITVLGCYIYQLTHSKTAIALVGLFGAVPAIGIALYGGYVADRSEKRRMLLILYGVVLVCSLFLCWGTSSWFIYGRWLLPLLYALIFCNGAARAFYEPAMHTVYARSISREHYANASNWDSASWQGASIIGPAAAGFLYAFAGITAVMMAVVFFTMVSWVFVWRLRAHPAVYIEKEPFGKSLLAGMRFINSNRMMLYALSLDLFCVLFGGVAALLPVYALDILKVGTEGLGLMRMAISLGAASTMLGMMRFSPMARSWRNLLIAVAGFGCCIIFFGLSHSFFLSLILLFLQGAFDSVSVLIRGTLMQLLTPDGMRGRVSAVNSMFIGSSSEIGDFESGVAAGLFGTVPAVVFGGVMTLLIVGLTFSRTRKLLSTNTDSLRAEPDGMCG